MMVVVIIVVIVIVVNNNRNKGKSLSFFRGDRCEPVPQVKHAFADSTNATRGATVNYRCLAGHLFGNETDIYTAFCDGASWNTGVLLPTCEGILCSDVADQ